MLKKCISLSVAIMFFVVASISQVMMCPVMSMEGNQNNDMALSEATSSAKRLGKSVLEGERGQKDRRYAQGAADYAQGLMYYSERAEYSEAFEFFKRAASFNHPRAMFYVGLYHEFGLGVVERSLDEAAQWYTKALSGPEVCHEAVPGLKRVIQKKEGKIW